MPHSTTTDAAACRHLYGWFQDIAAFILVYKGKILASFGNESRQFRCNSMRKSFLSSLYGIHAEEGQIDLDMTLEQLAPPSLLTQTSGALSLTAVAARASASPHPQIR